MLIFAPHVVQTFPEPATRSDLMPIFVKGYLGEKYGVRTPHSLQSFGSSEPPPSLPPSSLTLELFLFEWPPLMRDPPWSRPGLQNLEICFANCGGLTGHEGEYIRIPHKSPFYNYIHHSKEEREREDYAMGIFSPNSRVHQMGRGRSIFILVSENQGLRIRVTHSVGVRVRARLGRHPRFHPRLRRHSRGFPKITTQFVTTAGGRERERERGKAMK